MNRTLAIVAVALGCSLAPEISAQSGGESSEIERRVEAILDESFYNRDRIRTPLLLLGTFHFKDAGLDNFKPQHHIDVMSDKRQAEIQEIVDRLAEFQPTKIAVERKPADREALHSRYERYVNGEWELEANEIYQVGFRLAKQLGHEQVYPVDVPGRGFEPYVNPDDYAKEHGLTKMQRNPYAVSYFRLAQRMDAIKMEHPLREHFLLMNHPEMLETRHGIYLQRSISLGRDGEFPAADGFVSKWYNRNLRIFANIHRLAENEDDRILVIMGTGHVPLLRHFAQSAPEFEVVEVAEYLGP